MNHGHLARGFFFAAPHCPGRRDESAVEGHGHSLIAWLIAVLTSAARDRQKGGWLDIWFLRLSVESFCSTNGQKKFARFGSGTRLIF